MANRISVELPRASYYTGDVVAGSVVLQTDKEVDARGLYLDMTGYAYHLFAVQRQSARAYSSPPGLLSLPPPFA